MNTNEFFHNLKKFFEENPQIVDNKRVRVINYKDNYAVVFKGNGMWVNVRTLNKYEGYVQDIGMIFWGGEKARENFDKFYAHKDKIEKYLGKLVWQRFSLRNPNNQSSRISKFGPIVTKKKMKGASKSLQDEMIEKCYDFDCDEIEKVASELIKFYKVFVADELNLFG